MKQSFAVLYCYKHINLSIYSISRLTNYNYVCDISKCGENNLLDPVAKTLC